MIVLSVSQIYKSYGADTILNGVTLTVQTGERVALIGANGAGKTTLLKTITGELRPDQGEIHFAKEASLGYLSQHDAVESNRTVYEEMSEVFEDVFLLEERMRSLELQMADPAVYEDAIRLEKVAETYAQVSEEYARCGGFSAEARIRSILHGLDFQEEMYARKVGTLSGGQKTRLALGKLLLQEPTLLILDEPTNYLDIQTLTWLENHLKNYPGALLLVSHDRYFLDALVQVVYEMEHGQTTRYTGNYSTFIEEKAERMQQELKRFVQQQNEIEKMEDFIRRNLVRATTTKRAQSRRKMLEKTVRLERPDAHDHASQFGFSVGQNSGHEVLHVEGAAMQYESAPAPLFENLSLSIFRGDRAALLGPNGAGKSSLFKAILGRLPLIRGDIRFGTNVTAGYYTQEQEDLTLTKTVLQEVWDSFPKLDQTRVRTVLGNFLFSGDDVQKPIHALSGGERARVALAKLMLQEANLLLLDEPTNHLDLLSKEVLENALEDYPGTILFISHDRYFLNRIATRVLELSRAGTTSYSGNYDDYLDKKEQQIAQGYLPASPDPVSAKGTKEGDAASDREAKRQQERTEKRERKKRADELLLLETRIQQTEQLIKQLEEELCLPDVFQDVERSKQLSDAYANEKSCLEQLYEDWETLLEQAE